MEFVRTERFDEELRERLEKFEGRRQYAYDDGRGVPTIGRGHALLVNRHGEWTVNAGGMALSSEAHTLLENAAARLNRHERPTAAEMERISAAVGPIDDRNSRRLMEKGIEQAGSAVRNRLAANLHDAGAARQEADQLFQSLQGTRELQALTTLAYTGSGLIGPRLSKALAGGNRAEAWMEIRYFSNSARQDPEILDGMAKRRFAEAELIGPYADREHPTVQESLDLYRAYGARRSAIDAYERRYASERSDLVAEANRSYGPGSASTLEQTLEPAKRLLIERITADRPELRKLELERYPATDFVLTENASGPVLTLGSQGPIPIDPSLREQGLVGAGAKAPVGIFELNGETRLSIPLKGLVEPALEQRAAAGAAAVEQQSAGRDGPAAAETQPDTERRGGAEAERTAERSVRSEAENAAQGPGRGGPRQESAEPATDAGAAPASPAAGDGQGAPAAAPPAHAPEPEPMIA